MKKTAKMELLALRGARTKGPGLLGLALLVAVLSLASLTVRVTPAEAATFTVNTTNDVDDGACTASHCSLREAINAANVSADTDTITFNVPGPPPHTIGVVGQLPAVRVPVIIDGTTEPGYAGTPIVELDGTLSGGRQPGLDFYGGGSTVRGLVINRFKGSGIVLQQKGNYVIEDNYIGTDLTGTVDLGNGEGGIFMFPRAGNGGNTIARNVISGNGLNGIVLYLDRNVIQGNYIGTNASGTAALGNDRWGIRVLGPANDNVFGGTAPGQGNVISANGDDGIVIHGAVPTALTGNVIQGNYIGTNASGTAALGNVRAGIATCGNSTTIGGTALGARNIISGNGWNGIYICGSTGSVVQGNLIGTAADGTTALGNGLAGNPSFGWDSGISTRGDNNTIGGTAPGAANTIAYSTGSGVFIGVGARNGILSNSIFSNGLLGIDLYQRGVVQPNDPGDADRGPNELQNYPVLTSARGNTVEGTLNSTPNTSFRLEFFANREADPSGHGEGERFLGSMQVTTDGSGNASFTFVSPTPVFAGEFVSATATDPADNTSEFSRVVLFEPGPSPPANLTLTPKTDTNTVGEEHCVTATVTDPNGNPAPGITVRFSVSGANSASGSATTDANGQAQFCYTGSVAGTDTISAYADTNNNSVQDPGEPSDTAEKIYVAGPPATLTLEPTADVNTVDSEHCVTATVKHAFGNPTPGITVRFTVTGSVNTSGAVVTDANGQATFCYQGPALPGADVISAYADTNNNGVQDPGEPSDRATKEWVLPESKAGCKVTYGGRITAANGDKATFGGNAQVPASGPKGEEDYQDHGPAQPRNVHSLTVQAVTCSANKTQASIFGQATIDGAGTFDYRIDLKDLSEPGTSDTYRIRLSDGYDSGEQVLHRGNVQIHK
jgi:CSLREA domain-containing protein